MSILRVPAGAIRQKKRIGRGSGSGTGKTSGKGHKGQNARSGGGVRPGFEGGQMPLYRRIARRGFSNYPFKVEYLPVNLDRLSSAFDAGATVDLAALKAAGLVSRNAVYVKILGRGEIDKALTLTGLRVSAGAQAKIEAAGGSVTAPVAEG
ncbi:MAG: 50S ribosomal protein L15 [Alkalispirochaeta sp.]